MIWRFFCHVSRDLKFDLNKRDSWMKRWIKRDSWTILFCAIYLTLFRRAKLGGVRTLKQVWKSEHFNWWIWLLFLIRNVIVLNFTWTWKNFGYYLWCVKRPRTFFASQYSLTHSLLGRRRAYTLSLLGHMLTLQAHGRFKPNRFKISKPQARSGGWGGRGSLYIIILCKTDVQCFLRPRWRVCFLEEHCL